nr:hypothetical protein [Brochothrix campestris]
MPPQITTAKAIEQKDRTYEPDASWIRNPRVIGAMKPPIADPVLIKPMEEPIMEESNNLWGQLNMAVKAVVEQRESKRSSIIESAKTEEYMKPIKNKAVARQRQTISRRSLFAK